MTGSPYSDLDRPPLNAAALSRALTRDGELWREVGVVARTGSTNADLLTRASDGAAEGLVLVAEEQDAGRGRLDRTWSSPPRAGLCFSVLLRPDVPQARLSWLSLLAGVATVRAVQRIGGVEARVKWPNDVVVEDRKLAGILAERMAGAVVVGTGLNVSVRTDELPVPTATSMVIEGAANTDRDPLLRAVLRETAASYRAWVAAGGDPDTSGLRDAYRDASATIGREVRVELPGDRTLTGLATDVDELGRIIVGGEPVGAGDVVHLRPASG
ncbi:MAG TPA: biotin--[acetyl-CoA-carboxylase] ligase [Streptosporangiaceae bacterium]|jgi:BirA family biotin operon repressor/biotin-[acetyl-CoA-carboxylase] ligase